MITLSIFIAQHGKIYNSHYICYKILYKNSHFLSSLLKTLKYVQVYTQI